MEPLVPPGLYLQMEVLTLKKGNNFAVFITIVSALAAVAAAAVAVVLFFEKKRQFPGKSGCAPAEKAQYFFA